MLQLYLKELIIKVKGLAQRSREHTNIHFVEPKNPWIALIKSLIFVTSQGTLSDGRIVAVKQLSVASHQGKSQFVTEISTISAVQHRNLVKLYGFCIDGDRRLLVYEYLENRSLDQALFGMNILYTHITPSMLRAHKIRNHAIIRNIWL